MNKIKAYNLDKSYFRIDDEQNNRTAFFKLKSSEGDELYGKLFDVPDNFCWKQDESSSFSLYFVRKDDVL